MAQREHERRNVTQVRKLLLVGFLLFFLAGGALAEEPDWVRLGGDQVGLTEGFDSEYDRNSIRYDVATGMGTLWTRQVFRPGSEGHKRGVYAAEFQYEIDCHRRQVRGLAIFIEYLDGSVGWDDDWEEEWQLIKPNTMSQSWYEFTCP
jgi:hypothetical protein